MKKCKKALAIVLSLSMVVSGAALTNSTSADAAKKKVKLSAKKLSVYVGQLNCTPCQGHFFNLL